MLFLAVGGPLPYKAMGQDRTGFVSGLGMGAGYLSVGNSLGTSGRVAVDLKIGQGFSQHVQVYFSAVVSPFGGQQTFGRFGLGGISFRYFTEEGTPSIFVTLGGDIGVWGDDGPRTGFGPRLGVGYEFIPHWNVEGIFSSISGGDASNYDIASGWICLSYEF